jgi:hypothetical protein
VIIRSHAKYFPASRAGDATTAVKFPLTWDNPYTPNVRGSAAVGSGGATVQWRSLANNAIPRTNKIRRRIHELRATFVTSSAARGLIPEFFLE